MVATAPVGGTSGEVAAQRWGAQRLRELGRVVGRGACDMLGGVAAVLAAVRALRAAGVTLHRPLAVHLVSGEEDGGVGAFATLGAGHRGAACVIAEPTGGAVIPANAGSLTFRLEIPGRAAHGSTRTLGESAVDHLEPVLVALRALEARRNAGFGGLFAHLDLAAPLSVGVLRAGDWASTVPDLLVAEGRYGVLPGGAGPASRARPTGRTCGTTPRTASRRCSTGPDSSRTRTPSTRGRRGRAAVLRPGLRAAGPAPVRRHRTSSVSEVSGWGQKVMPRAANRSSTRAAAFAPSRTSALS